MYNRQLDIFIKTAECGSFSKAAQELYVTPSAVIQQVKALEERLDIRLFDRTSRGVALTEAGKYFYTESRKLIQKSNTVMARLENFREKKENLIRVAINLYHSPQLLYELWSRFQETMPECELKTEVVRKFSAECLEKTDLVEGIYFHEAWYKDFYFWQSHTIPVTVGVFGTNPLAQKTRITYEDLKETVVVTIRYGIEDSMDHIQDELTMRGIRVMPVNIYDHAAVITLCATRQYVILMPQCWKNMFENLVLIECEWDYTIPYGFFVSQKASAPAKRFVEFLQTQEIR